MLRTRLYDFRYSRGPQTVGLCQTNVTGIADMVNSAQRRLLMAREAGDEGWWGSWVEMAFTVSRTDPYITTPRGVARLEKMAVCNQPVNIQNQFYEYLQFGAGPQPTLRWPCGYELQAYSRNNAILFTNFSGGGLKLRIYSTAVADALAARVFIQGTDKNDMPVFTLDGTGNVAGEFVNITATFANTVTQWNTITGIQKDVTQGIVSIYQVNADGSETLLLNMEPSEKTADYRRYYLSPLPANCCHGFGTSTTAQVTAMAKLDLVPCAVDPDYLLIQNLEALIEEVQAIRLSEVDNINAKKMAQEKHLQAIRLLQGELVHFLGKEKPAISFLPFGSARLENHKIGTLM